MLKEKQEKSNSANTKKQSNLSFCAMVLLLILVIVASSAVGIFAWAKYQRAASGNLSGKVAKWSFKLADGIPETSDVIDFAITRTDTNTSVADGVLAPGTYGQFEIGIDARGTETILEYVIDIALINKPRNLKFYLDSEKTTEMVVTDNKITKKGFMSLDDVKQIKTETIYWDWPYTTYVGDSTKYDLMDVEDSGKVMTMQITVTGTEVLEEEQEEEQEEQAQILANVVSVGDYVNYDATMTSAGTSYTAYGSLTGKGEDQTFTVNDGMKWKVMSVDTETGKIELMAENPTSESLYLYGKEGYKNAETVLNNIGAIYGNGCGADGGRSITVEDVNKLENYTPEDSWDTYTYYSGIFIDEDGNKTVLGNNYYDDTSDGITLSYTPNTEEKSTNKDYSYTTTNFRNKSFWLASRCIYFESDFCGFNVRYCENRQCQQQQYFLFG